MRRLLVGFLLLIVVAYAALLAVGYFFSDQMIFLPHPCHYRKTANTVMLGTAHGSHIAAWYFPNPQAKYTILFSHGNGEDMGDNLDYFEELHDSGFAVMGYDYDGYGLSDGTPTEANIYDDAEAAYAFLTEQQHVPPDRIIIFGRSVGTGAAIELAKRHRPRALIVQSGFVSTFRVLTRYPLIPFDRFRNLAKIRAIDCPKLFIHGRADSVVPFWHGVALFNAASGPKQSWWVDGANHNDLEYLTGAKYFQVIKDFAAGLD